MTATLHYYGAMNEPARITIGPMMEEHLESVLVIERASYAAPWKREHFLHELTSPHSFPFVALRDGTLVGYVCLMSLFEDAQILDIAVAPDMRGRGIAQLLLEYAMSVAREKGAELLALEVRSTNREALSLYERNGFVRSGLRQKYYEGRDDAVLMEKNLT